MNRLIYADALINLIPAPIYISPDGQDLVLMSDVMEAIQRAPTIDPEPHYDEWCTDCKEYDHERHCCPRWNRVIRETLKDAQPEIIRCKDCEYGDQDEVGRWFCTSLGCQIGDDDGSGFCADAERRTE